MKNKINTYNSNESVSLENISNISYLPKSLLQTLTDGFVELFGEEKRSFFESIQDEMFKEGYDAGEKCVYLNGLKSSSNAVRSAFRGLENRRTNPKCTLPEISEEDMRVQLEELFGDNIDKMLNRDFKDVKGGNNLNAVYEYYKNINKYTKQIIKELGSGESDDVPKLYNKNPENFETFKKYKLHEISRISLYSESGLNLDSFNKKNIDYYLFEGEFFYMIEAISNKYYLLGAFIAQQDLKEQWINKGIEIFNIETDHDVYSAWKDYLETLSYNFEEKALINTVRKAYGIKNKSKDIHNKLRTHKEITEYLSTCDFSDLPDDLFKK